MYTRTTILAAVLLTAASLAAQDKRAAKPVDVARTRDLSVASPNGPGSRVLTLQQDGEKLTGEIDSTISSGKVAGPVKGNAIAYTATVAMDTGTDCDEAQLDSRRSRDSLTLPACPALTPLIT